MYQVLYRKYRPRVFADVYGQDHVTATLKNEIKEGRISHAYLFTGSRGTGKTTCAKLLAKAVNCENSVDGEPCNTCDVCRGLDAGTIYDVVEIDAASNNGVDNIRDLREEVNYTPSRGKYRVYIIDEVHMLSTGAFNALLKTLEEPPAHVIFILATTEVHKLPATILSRCQRFDFKRIQPETMAVRLQQVAGLEGVTLDADAAVLIARIADGALRDGLSILDQCAGRSKAVTAQLVSEVAGLAGREALYQLSGAVAAHDSSTAMGLIADLHANSYDMERLCVEMISHMRNFLIVKTVKKSRPLLVCTDDEYEMIRQSARQFTMEAVIRALDLLQDTLTIIKSGADARIEMEMAFVRLSEPKLDAGTDALLDRLAAVERAVRTGAPAAAASAMETPPPAAAQPTQTMQDALQPKTAEAPLPGEAGTAKSPQGTELPIQSEPQAPMPERAPAGEQAENAMPIQPLQIAQETETFAAIPADTPLPSALVQEALSQNEEVQKQQPFMQWGEFMDVIYRTDIALFGILNGAKGFIRGDFFLIDSSNPTIKEFIKISTHSRAIKNALLEVTGKQYKLGLFKQKAESASVPRDPLEDLLNQARGKIEIHEN